MEEKNIQSIALYVDAKPSLGGGFSYWMDILVSLNIICKKRKIGLIVFSPNDDWRDECKSLGIEYVNSQLSTFSCIVNKIAECIIPRIIYLKIIKYIIPYIGIAKDKNVKAAFSNRPDNKLFHVLGIKQICPIWDLMHKYEPQFEEVGGDDEITTRDNYFLDICHNAKVVLADSKIGKQHILDTYGSYVEGLKNKIEILPYIPADYIYQKEEKKCERLRFEKYVFYPAQFWTHKNHINLIKAISKLSNEGIIVNLVFVGAEKNNLESVKRAIITYDLIEQVQILGFVSNKEMVYLYKNARMLCMPTFFGPTNIPPLEAFALGCPVAISGIYATLEQVGDAALLFNPNSVDEIADCIKMLWTDDGLCADLIQKGFAKTKSWGQEQFTKRLEEIIEKVLRGQNESV